MNILKRELRANLKALIIWCIILIFLIFAGMAKFTALGPDGAGSIMNAFPAVFKVMFGAFPGLDLSTTEGAYGMLYLYVLIMAGIYAVLLGSGIISKEERDKTTEFLMVKPVTRDTILKQKLLAVLINALIFDIITLVSSVAAMTNYANADGGVIGHIALMTLGVLFVQLVFIGIGMVFAATFKDSKRSGLFAIVILLVMYLLYTVVGITDINPILRVFSPFAYFLPGSIIAGNFGLIYALICVLIFAILMILTFRAYRSRDLAI